ncbi:MAG: biotin--[acetyl-CoA-carboxylase] ligase [Bacteroidetes bacterium]|nr:biotin--[acetyl-CoA-carboxylase] ligase [Bacteroidota bacterium]
MIGTRRIALEKVDSTNRYARDLLTRQPGEGTVVTAEIQSAGRGRMQRNWRSPLSQNLLATVILYPAREGEEWGGLPLLAGVAVTQALQRLAPIEVHVKWPNDVLVDEKKISGILVETGIRNDVPWALIGIGVNVNQQHFEGEYRLPPTSLALEAGRPFDTDEVLSEVCRDLDLLYTRWTAEGNPPILQAWREATRMFGRKTVIEQQAGRVEGEAIDIDADGALLIRTPDGAVERILAGDALPAPDEGKKE